MTSYLLTSDNILRFMLAGNAVFTIRNTRTGNRYTYKVTAPDDDNQTIRFVRVMVGPDNENSYAYVGFIKLYTNLWLYNHGNKSSLRPDDPRGKGFEWVFTRLTQHLALPEHVQVWHEGHCARCGRRLTVPESIQSGFGPECARQLQHKKHQQLVLL